MTNEVTEALTGISTTHTSSINPGTIAAVIGMVLAAGIALFLTWFGAKKLISVVKNALKGRLKI